MTAATFVLVTPDGQALMELRSDAHWCYPGGKIETDEDGDDIETPEEAMVREMMEEIGCVPKAWSPLHITAYGRTDQIGNPAYRMVPFIVWGWEGDVPTDLTGEGLNREETPLRWIPLLQALAAGRGSCVTPIAAATLYQLDALLRERQEGLGAEYWEPNYTDKSGILRFGGGRMRADNGVRLDLRMGG